jgi:murein DD-endopeptidase MepM/ murein hydrolase activator NlpD
MSRRATCLGFGFILLTTAGIAAGCSANESAGDSSPELQPGASTGEAQGSDGDGDQGAPPNDDPSLGSESVDPTTGADAGTDGSSPNVVPKGNGCVAGGRYCGGDKVTGDSKTLYKCNGAATPTVVEKCASGCMVNSGSDDSCAPAAGARVASPVPGKVVTYPFGVKNASYAAGYHTGDDYATPTGSNAVAVWSGTIRWSNSNGGAYGNWIGLDADNGRTYVYCHLSSRLVASGTKVVAGQLIAKTGATGNVTGPHLHFEDHPKGAFVYGQVRKPAW